MAKTRQMAVLLRFQEVMEVEMQMEKLILVKASVTKLLLQLISIINFIVII